MKTDSEHTPLPWIVAGKTVRFHNLNAGPGVSICTMSNGVNAEYAAPNAAFIVRACNAHDELVAALEEAKNQLQTVLASSRHYGFDNERINLTSAAILRSSNAIAKAKGD